VPVPCRPSRLFQALTAGDESTRPRQGALADHPANAGVSSPLANAHVLLAEDNPVNQEVAKAMLASLGCHTTLATNGVQALAAACSRHFDVILMDCQMAEMDGYEASRRIRHWEKSRRQDPAARHRPVPIIAVTAHAMIGDRDKCLAAGMNDYLAKPFDRAALQAMLQKHLNPDRAQAAGDAAPSCGTTLETTAEPLLDRRALQAILAISDRGSHERLARIIRLYLDDAPALLAAIRAGIASNAADEIRQAAHSLKSSSANLGAARVRDIARRLEECGRQTDLAAAAALLPELEETFARTCAALRKEAAAGRPTT
jgi:CheY-like chemotaxis protein/HPt (histidine-containing phosphotransfer) domain-containing protein